MKNERNQDALRGAAYQIGTLLMEADVQFRHSQSILAKMKDQGMSNEEIKTKLAGEMPWVIGVDLDGFLAAKTLEERMDVLLPVLMQEN